MSSSTKPYLARALWEWCSDNGYTPLIHVLVTNETKVPLQFVKEGQIVLNISQEATRGLQMTNDQVQFNARFGGVSQEVNVPWQAVTGLFARETGEGMFFDVEVEEEIENPQDEPSNSLLENTENVSKIEKKGKPTLTIIK